MKLQGTYTFTASQDDVWDALLDPSILAQALPGGEALQQVGENEYQAVLNMRVGPVQGRFEGGIELSDIQPKRAYRMNVSGQGAPGFVKGNGLLNLAAAADGGTELVYSGDVEIGGKIAGLSQRLVESTARSIIKQGLAALDAQIQLRNAPAELVTPPPVPLTAAQEAKEMVSEGAPVVPVEGETAAPDALTPEWQPLATAEPRPLESRATTARPAPLPRAEGAEAGQRGAVFTASATAKADFGDVSFAKNVVTDVITDIASDYIPRKHQEKVLWATIGAAAAFLFVALVRLVQKK